MSARVAIDWDDIRHRLEQARRAVEDVDTSDRATQERILRERAALLARPPAHRSAFAASSDVLELLVFQAGGEHYAFDTACVAQVCPMLPLTPLPGVPAYVAGIVAMQGEVLSVVDLRVLLDLPVSGLSDPKAIVVLKGELLEFGVLAEDIVGIERHSTDTLKHAPPNLGDTARTYLKGVTASRAAVLDAALMLSDPRLTIENG